MEINLSEALTDGQWFDHPDGGKLKIRSYPATREKFAVKYSDGKPEIVFSGVESFDKFKYCLVEWKDVTDSNGKELKLTDTLKEQIYNFRVNGLDQFVFDKEREIGQEVEQSAKNS